VIQEVLIVLIGMKTIVMHIQLLEWVAYLIKVEEVHASGEEVRNLLVDFEYDIFLFAVARQ
jgi:hypothetical protein